VGNNTRHRSTIGAEYDQRIVMFMVSRGDKGQRGKAGRHICSGIISDSSGVKAHVLV
jgi:hypothetical protein